MQKTNAQILLTKGLLIPSHYLLHLTFHNGCLLEAVGPAEGHLLSILCYSSLAEKPQECDWYHTDFAINRLKLHLLYAF